MKICKRGLHSFEGRRCGACQKEAIRIWTEANKEKMVDYYKAWHQKNKVKRNEATRRRYRENIEHFKEYGKKHREANKLQNAARYKRWRIENPHKETCKRARLRCLKVNAIPRWLTKGDLTEIQWAYELAKNKSIETGIMHVVDHIIPLNNPNICGLHCPQNLQIITASENSRKKNKWPYP